MPEGPFDTLARGIPGLVAAVHGLALARTMHDLEGLVPHAARTLVAADAATFALRDGERCSFVGEDAVAPLWKGHRMKLARCVSGWAIDRGMPVVIHDVEDDGRTYPDLRGTFVKSLVVVPVGNDAARGAIGAYWNRRRYICREDVELLVSLADATATALDHLGSRSLFGASRAGPPVTWA